MGVDEIEGRIGKRQRLAVGHRQPGLTPCCARFCRVSADGAVGEVDAGRHGRRRGRIGPPQLRRHNHV